VKKLLEKYRYKDSLKASVKESYGWAIMESFGINYIQAYAIHLKSSSLQIALLGNLIHIIGGIGQFFGSFLVSKIQNRLLILKTTIFLQGVFWLLIGLLPFIIKDKNLLTNLNFILFISFFLILTSSLPAWISLLGDLVPSKIRGKYFGIRNKYSTLVLILSLIISGIILEFTKYHMLAQLGYLICFFLAGLGRLYSAYQFTKHIEPEYIEPKVKEYSFLKFIKIINKLDYGNFVIFYSLLLTGVQTLAPFVAIFLLDYLDFTYIEFSLFFITGLFGRVITQKKLGELTDKIGSANVIKLSGIIISIIPLLLAISTNHIYLILINIIGGIGWGGMILTENIYLYEKVPKQNRAKFISYKSIIAAAACLIGVFLGDFILKLASYEFLYLFIFSAVFRIIVCSLFFSKIKSVKIS